MGQCCSNPSVLEVPIQEAGSSITSETVSHLPAGTPKKGTLQPAEGATPASQAAHAWLHELSLSQYTPAFEASGYDDWPQLTQLNEVDLDAIAQCAGVALLPGHRKKLLLASKQLAEARHTLQLGAGGSVSGTPAQQAACYASVVLAQGFNQVGVHGSCRGSEADLGTHAPTITSRPHLASRAPSTAVPEAPSSQRGRSVDWPQLAAAAGDYDVDSQESAATTASPAASPVADVPRPASARKRWEIQASAEGVCTSVLGSPGVCTSVFVSAASNTPLALPVPRVDGTLAAASPVALGKPRPRRGMIQVPPEIITLETSIDAAEEDMSMLPPGALSSPRPASAPVAARQRQRGRTVAVPIHTPSLAWDQDHALCIKGSQYQAAAAEKLAPIGKESISSGASAWAEQPKPSPLRPQVGCEGGKAGDRPRPGAITAGQAPWSRNASNMQRLAPEGGHNRDWSSRRQQAVTNAGWVPEAKAPHSGLKLETAGGQENNTGFSAAAAAAASETASEADMKGGHPDISADASGAHLRGGSRGGFSTAADADVAPACPRVHMHPADPDPDPIKPAARTETSSDMAGPEQLHPHIRKVSTPDRRVDDPPAAPERPLGKPYERGKPKQVSSAGGSHSLVSWLAGGGSRETFQVDGGRQPHVAVEETTSGLRAASDAEAAVEQVLAQARAVIKDLSRPGRLAGIAPRPEAVAAAAAHKEQAAPSGRAGKTEPLLAAEASCPDGLARKRRELELLHSELEAKVAELRQISSAVGQGYPVPDADLPSLLGVIAVLDEASASGSLTPHVLGVELRIKRKIEELSLLLGEPAAAAAALGDAGQESMEVVGERSSAGRKRRGLEDGAGVITAVPGTTTRQDAQLRDVLSACKKRNAGPRGGGKVKAAGGEGHVAAPGDMRDIERMIGDRIGRLQSK